MITYLKNSSKHFVCNYHASVAIISYLDKYTCENAMFTLVTFMTLENDIKTLIWQ